MSELLSPEPKALSLWAPEAIANPAPLFLLPGFVPAQGLTIVAGRPKIGMKSWAADIMAMCVATGISAGPFKPLRAAPVLFYSREGVAGPIAHRKYAIEAGMGIPVAACDKLYFVQNGAFFLDEPAHMRRTLDFIQKYEVELVVIDTLAKSFRGDENSVRDVSAALRGVEKIRDAGAATLLVHHLGKDKSANTGVGGEPDPDAGLRGSSALAGAYDNIISVQELEIDGCKELWAVVGGKYLPFQGYKYGWDIKSDKDNNPTYAKLVMSEKKDLPQLDVPQGRPRYGG